MPIFNNVLEIIGKTPLVELRKLNKNGCAKVFVKLESKNPGGSIKDRPALSMIEEAEKAGKITNNTVIIEPTSGNMGVGLAMICAVKGYKLILTMPESMSLERRALLKAYGAELVLTPKEKGMQGAVDKALELMNIYPKTFMPQQFNNAANPLAHEKTTALEILDDLDGKLDIFVAGFGTAGTVCGCAKVFKQLERKVEIIALEPETSPLLTKGQAGAHKIQGIGANFIPKVLDTKIYDKIIPVSNEDSFAFGKELGKTEGVLAGISSGAVLWAAVELAKKDEYAGKNIVIILCDTGDRYLSTPLFSD